VTQTSKPSASPVPPVPSCQTRTRLYRRGKVTAEGFGAAEIPKRLGADPGAVLWLDLLDPDENDLRAVTELFSLHPLAVEDAVHDHQRPKLDHYDGHLFLNLYSVRVTTDGPRPVTRKEEISAFITDRALITVRKSDSDTSAFVKRWDDDPTLAEHGGVAFLVYGLLDVVVDGHLAAARKLDLAMDTSEDSLLEEGGAPRPVRVYAFGLRKSLVMLRRAVAPMPEIVADVLKLERGMVDEKLRPYYLDVDDHARRAVEAIDSARERISGLLEADLNERSDVLNEITRKLAAWAAVIAVPTALTGFFGQNVPFWGYEKATGFAVSLGLVVFSALGLYLYLKRRNWL
jgi:magnesium transporter